MTWYQSITANVRDNDDKYVLLGHLLRADFHKPSHQHSSTLDWYSMHLSSNSSLHRAVKKLQSRYYDWHTDPQKPYSSGPKPNRTPKGDPGNNYPVTSPTCVCFLEISNHWQLVFRIISWLIIPIQLGSISSHKKTLNNEESDWFGYLSLASCPQATSTPPILAGNPSRLPYSCCFFDCPPKILVPFAL